MQQYLSIQYRYRRPATVTVDNTMTGKDEENPVAVAEVEDEGVDDEEDDNDEEEGGAVVGDASKKKKKKSECVDVILWRVVVAVAGPMVLQRNAILLCSFTQIIPSNTIAAYTFTYLLHQN